MNSKRPIDVGISSSLIDLKAELLKKHAEAQSSKSRQQGAQKSLKKSELLKAKNVYSAKNPGIENRSKKDQEVIAQEELTIEKSRSILEAKAKLYEKMTSEALEHDEHEHPVLSQSLVNFTQKAIDQINESREKKQRQQSINNIRKKGTEEEYETVNKELDYFVNEDEWTEFTDALGRTRRCLKSDLPSFISRDEELARPLNPGICLSREAAERLIEMKRQKWEQETEEASVKEKVHYQDVLYDEVRSHGVGFYGFSKDETVRQEQLKELKKLSEQTGATREKVLKERSAKKSVLKERLKKIRAKKRAKLGLPVEEEDSDDEAKGADVDDDDGSCEQKEKGDGPQGAKKKRVDLDPNVLEAGVLLEDEKEKAEKMRPWDFGKANVFGPRPKNFDELDEKWLRDRRSDRITEFAPPSSLYKGGMSQGGLKKGYSSSGGGAGRGGNRKEISSTSSSGSSQSNSSSSYVKYSNFVKSNETLGGTAEPSSLLGVSSSGPEPSTHTSSSGMKVFRPPEQFWKGNTSSKPSSGGFDEYRMQKAIPIVDELAAPVADNSDEFERGRGTEIAPPLTFDFYQREVFGPGRGRGSSSRHVKSDEVVADAVSSGLKALRERFEAEQRAKAHPMNEKDKKEFKGFI